MSEIQNIIPGLIPVGEYGGKQAVSGRMLHEFLQVETAYNIWFGRMLNYDFEEGRDFQTFLIESSGGRPGSDHALSLPMAKELSMIQRTERGKQARQYFIEMEGRALATPALPQGSELLALAVIEAQKVITAKDEQIAELAPKAEYVDRFVGERSDIITIDVFAGQFGSTGPKVRELLWEKSLAARKVIGERWSDSKQEMEDVYEWRARQGRATTGWFELLPQHKAPRLHNGQVRQTMYVRQFHAEALAAKLGLTSSKEIAA